MQNNKLTPMMVEDYLMERGFKVGMRGFHYIVEAVLIWENDFTIRDNIYNYFGERDNVTPVAVERNIRHSITTANIDHITNREFIAYTKLMLLRRCE